MNFKEYLQKHIVYLDGGMGTLLQEAGLLPGEYPERWNLTHPRQIISIQTDYFNAGSNVVCTNTFGANRLKFSAEELDEIIRAAIQNAREAASRSTAVQEKFVALDIGPTGKLLKPLGDLDFEEAVSVFAETVRIGVRYGVDLILIETMNDSYETKAALLAAKENSDLPVIVTNAYGSDGKLMTGASPAAMVALLEGMGADAIGANCSLGPKQLRGVAQELLSCASVPVVLKPNAGLPRTTEDGATEFDVGAAEFAEELAEPLRCGVRVVGGCCGTTPDYIRTLTEQARGISPLPLTDKQRTVVSSYTHAVSFDRSPILIGERINPTGKKRLKQALIEGDMDYILSEGSKQQEAGAHILDVNVGLPDIKEAELLPDAVCQLQALLSLPLQIDTSDPVAMEAAMRRYNGKAMINSVNGKQESMDAIFPLVKKYGGLLVALTLDETGIPSTAEGRVAIAKRILNEASAYGIAPKDIIFDPLAMTVSTDPSAATVTLDALRRIRTELKAHTSLGVSNVSFGLPCRDAINSTFFAMALENGLSAAIMNPHSADMMRTYYTYRALHGVDPNCEEYIAACASFTTIPSAPSAEKVRLVGEEPPPSLMQAIIKGRRDKARELTELRLSQTEPMRLVQEEIIPALNMVGKEFERGTVYLPQLLMSAEAAKAAFECIKNACRASGSAQADRGSVLLATVKGDIHDIGKNIVRLLLENYGFDVTDLGKDVPPEVIVAEAKRLHSPLVGLSALMTTTVPAMEQTIALLRRELPSCRVVVGGAVLNRDYAARIGADHYAPDAMDTVRYAEELFNSFEQ